MKMNDWRGAPNAKWLAGIGFCALLLFAIPLLLSLFESREAARASGQLAQVRATLTASLERFDPLPAAIAVNPDAVRVAKGGDTAGFDEQLARLSSRVGLEAIYLMNRAGLTLAASNHDRPDGFVGRSYDFRPYFQSALDGKTGRYFGVGATTGRPGYFIAEPIRDADEIVGVLAAKVSLSSLERSWAEGDPVFVTDADGIVILASDPAWHYRSAIALEDGAIGQARAERRYGGATLDPFDGPLVNGWRLPAEAAGAIHLAAAALPHGWTIHYLADGRPARLQVWIVLAGLLLMAATFLLFRQRRHAGLIRSALGRSQAEERQLREANDRLAAEIEERRAAEARLDEAQTELRRASRLAALGQLAASVGHELSQPIAALRNHMAAERIRGETGGALRTRLPDLVERMEGIIRQLKLFGRPVEVNFAPVDMGASVGTALDLLAANIEAADVDLNWSAPTGSVQAIGDALRIEQVLVNLIRNAIDAVEASEDRRVTITVDGTDRWAVVTVADAGPGLGGRSFSDLAAPFETTRTRSGGLGLGLAIARQIVHEHDGELDAADADGGGACFTLRLPRARGAQ